MGWMTPIIVSAAQRAEESNLKAEIGMQLGSAWELKVLRSTGCLFGCEDALQEAVLEEAQAGWELAWRIDEARLILRRPVSARLYDSQLPPDLDPYREYFRSTFGMEAAIVAGLMLLALVIAFGVIIVANYGG